MTMIEVAKMGECKKCSKAGACRCIVCKTWYCSKECQADHWPTHWRECLPVPDLEWPVLQTTSSAAAEVKDHAPPEPVSAVGDTTITKVGSAKIVDVTTDSNTPSPVKPPTKISTATVAANNTKESSYRTEDAKETSHVKEQPEISKEPSKQASSTPVVCKEPVRPAPPVPTSVPASNEVEKKSQAGAIMKYEDVIISDKMVEQRLTKKVHEILPVDEAVSPNNFVIRLAEEEQECLEVLGLLNENMPGADPGASWKIGRKEVVAVLHEELWYRAMAVKKIGAKFQCFLLDFGNHVTVGQDQMRPLPEPFISVPPFAYQVCLAAFGPSEGKAFTEEDGSVFRDLFSADENYIFVAEFLGKADGGRYLVDLKGKDDNESISKLLIEAGMGAERKDDIVIPMEKLIVEAAPAPKVVPAMADPVPITGPVVERGTLKPGTNGVKGGVCYFANPDTFWVCASEMLDAFSSILTESQDAPEGKVNPVIGTCCLALDDGTCWYRAEILGLGSDKTKAKVFLLDYGKIIEQPVQQLKPLPDTLASIPGLVVLIKLRNIQPGDGTTWSKDEKDASMLALDVGGETMFSFKHVEPLQDEVGVSADLEDEDGNDLASFLVECGVGRLIVEEVGMPPRNVLKPGEQELFILGVESPKEMFLCTNEQFDYYSDTMNSMINDAAEKAPAVSEVKVGDKVIVFSEELHYRAVVMELLKDGSVKVDMIDLANEKDVSKAQLKKADAQLFKLPILAVKCGLDSWKSKDDKEAQAAGEHLKSLMDVYDKVHVNVKESSGDINMITIPSIEEKLAKKLNPTNMARANLLKLKMKRT